MIPRYSRPEMAALWSDDARFEIWLEVELAHLEAREARGLVTLGVAARIRESVAARPISAERILEHERITRHDVIAFLTHIEELAGRDARFLHVGLTSSDVLDTTLAVQLARAAREIDRDIDGLCEALREQAMRHKMTAMVGRSHGIHAEPTTFGLALAGSYAELRRG